MFYYDQTLQSTAGDRHQEISKLKRIWPYTVPAQTHSPRPKVTVEHSHSYLLPPSAPRSSSGFSGSNLAFASMAAKGNSPASRGGDPL
jgi:hypothetical protein